MLVKILIISHTFSIMIVHRILKGITFGSNYGSPGFAASYLIQTVNKNILFDVGHNGLRNVIVNELQRHGLSPKSIDIVILSHDHWDHVMNYSMFDNSRFIIGYASESGRNGDWAYVPLLGEKLKEMDTLFVKKADIVYCEGVKIISVPGHTEGDIAAVIENSKEIGVFTGDTIPSMNAFRQSKPDLIFYSVEEASKSYRYLQSFSPTLIYPGHDAPFRLKPMKYVFEKDHMEGVISGNIELNFEIK